MNEITEKMVWAAGVAVNPELFSTIPHEAHRAASPRRVDVVREEVLGRCRIAVAAALAAAEAQPVAWMADGWVMVPVERIEGLREAYDKVKLWPENRMSEEAVLELGQGFADLLALRNAAYRAILAARPTPSVDTEARRLALEEAAKIAESTGIDNMNEWPGETWIAQRIASAIRALIPQEGEYTAHDGEKI